MGLRFWFGQAGQEYWAIKAKLDTARYFPTVARIAFWYRKRKLRKKWLLPGGYKKFTVKERRKA